MKINAHTPGRGIKFPLQYLIVINKPITHFIWKEKTAKKN